MEKSPKEKGLIPVVCCSKGRWSKVLTKELIKDLIIVCPASEKELYEQHNPECNIIPQPKHVKGLVPARQFILDTFPEVFMIDDDADSMLRNYEDDNSRYRETNPDAIRDIIEMDANIARNVGAKMFGYPSIRKPNEYRAVKPFKFTGYINNSYMGFLKGHDLAYDLDMNEGEDHYISCLNVYRNRYMFIDTRFTFKTVGNFTATGGVNGERTLEDMKENTFYLRKKFGEVISIKTPSANKTKVNKYERSISFPY